MILDHISFRYYSRPEILYLIPIFSRFGRKSRLLQWLVFFVSSTRSVHFLCINKPFQSRRVPFPLFSTLRLSPFFRHCETSNFSFFLNFFIVPPSIFDILQQNGCSKNPKGSPFYIFWRFATYRRLQKKSENFFLILFFESFCCLQL